MLALKRSLISAVLGLTALSPAFANCDVYLGPEGSQIISNKPDGTSCAFAYDIESGSSILIDVVAGSFSFFSLYGMAGSLQDFRMSGTSWAYTNVPQGDLTATFSGISPDFEWVLGVYPQHVDPPLPVPEPSTYALMILGLGAIGIMARRRTRALV